MRLRDSNRKQRRNNMRIVAGFIGFLLMGIVACSPKQEIVVADNHQAKIDKQNKFIMALSAKVDSLEKIIEENKRKSLSLEHGPLLFTLERTACMGACPVFKLEVYTDGFVSYKGRSNVNLIGVYTGTLKPEKIEKAIQFFNQADFYSFDDKYNDGRLDIPSTIIEFFGSKGHKKVEASTGIPKDFRILASELESLIKEIDWTLTDY